MASQLLCNAMDAYLTPYIQVKGYIQLIKCFLNPQLMLFEPEFPNPLWKHTPVELGGHLNTGVKHEEDCPPPPAVYTKWTSAS